MISTEKQKVDKIQQTASKAWNNAIQLFKKEFPNASTKDFVYFCSELNFEASFKTLKITREYVLFPYPDILKKEQDITEQDEKEGEINEKV